MGDTSTSLLKYVPVNYEILIRGMSQFTGMKVITACDVEFVLAKMQDAIYGKMKELNLPAQNFRLMLMSPTTHECNFAALNSIINYYKLIETNEENKNRSLLPISCKLSEEVKTANGKKYSTIDGYKKAQHRHIYISPDYPINLTDWSYTDINKLLKIIDTSTYEMQFVCQVSPKASERNQLRLELIQHINNLFANPAKHNPSYFPLWGKDKTIKPFIFSTDKEENDNIWKEVLATAIEEYKHSGVLEINQREIPLNPHVFKTSEDVIDAFRYGKYEGQENVKKLVEMMDRIRAKQKAGEIIPPPSIDDIFDRTF